MDDKNLGERDVSRRDFLLGSATIGGLLIGARLADAQSGLAKRGLAIAGDDAQFNAWIHIGGDNQIGFILDKAEMGQGVITGLTAIVAEELGVGLFDIHVQFAPPGAQFGNPKMFDAQITGGSTSVAGAWDPLRQAAADVRARLMAAGAANLGVPAKQCVLSAQGPQKYAIVDSKTGKSVFLGDVANRAAGMTGILGFGAVKGTVKPASQYTVLGKSQPMQRYDAWNKVTGQAKFGIDTGSAETIKSPLNCAIIRPPVNGAKLTDYQPKNAGDVGALYLLPLKSGLAVVAETFWQALSTAKKITVQWDAGDAAKLNSTDLAAAYRSALAQRGKQANPIGPSYGAVENQYKQCNMQIDVTFELPYLPHATMEPMNCTAHFQGSSCEIWAPTQSATASREIARQVTGIDANAIQVHTTFLGGGFGRRIYTDYVAEAVHISYQLFTRFGIDRAVKVTWTREDDFKHDYYRPMVAHRARVGLKPDGTIGAWLHHTAGQSIFSYISDVFINSLAVDMLTPTILAGAAKLFDRAFQLPGVVDPTSVEGLVTGAVVPDAKHVPYACRIPYVSSNFFLEVTNIVQGAPVGFWRSVGHSHTGFVIESVIDDLAHQSGRDPMEFREFLLAQSLAEVGFIQKIEGAADRIRRSQTVLATVKTLANWGQPRAGRAQGVAMHESFDTICAMVAEVSVTGLGAARSVRVHRVFAAVDCGFALTPDIVKVQVESAVIFGLTAALKQKITLVNGEVQQNNFYDCDLLRMHECPEIQVAIVPSTQPPTGIGEPGVPPIAPAVRNAILAATGISLYSLPIKF